MSPNEGKLDREEAQKRASKNIKPSKQKAVSN